ncbi:cytochrome P450 1A1 [Patella vulgata]|uniref:cytochrome P450 1A1 n=1 Tax=Patella vulgata TaxID=6465 RepID=UPI00217F5072|nr:cytochrome P450 1A1 [Patella vulgata]XP_050395929.1 cytochrome P450 1A1 [Patella vulgata]
MLESIVKQITLSWTSQALLLGLTVGLVTYYTFGKKKYKLPPGPWAPPLLGHLREINSPPPIFKKLLKWRKEYGPAITIYFGPLKCVTLNSADSVNEALVKKAADYAGRLQTWSMGHISDGYKNIVFSDVNPSWKQLRKIGLQGLRQCLSGNKLEEKLFESTSKVMRRIQEENGKPVDIQKYISLLVFNLLHGVCFNKSFDIDDQLFLKLLNVLDEATNDFGNGFFEDVFPPLRRYPTAKFRKIMSTFAYFQNFINDEFNKHFENFSEDNMNDITDFLLNARKQAVLEDPAVESIITNSHLSQTVKDIFIAGVDTTRQTITWTILLLVTHPEIQKKVQDELDQVLDAGQAPTLGDRERLSYTEAVLHESMRLCPVLPIGLPHTTRCDTTIGEYEIPKGTMVAINHWALHNDPEVWKDPDVFRPERFLDEYGKLEPKTMSWLPFSAGRRNCLGETVARPELHLMLALLLRNMKFSCPDGQTMDMNPLATNSSISFVPPLNYVIAEQRQ